MYRKFLRMPGSTVVGISETVKRHLETHLHLAKGRQQTAYQNIQVLKGIPADQLVPAM